MQLPSGKLDMKEKQMSVLLEFAMFPTDKGSSVSAYVSKVIEMIRSSGAAYRLTPMGTVVETETMEKALDILQKAYAVLEPVSERIYCSAKFDIRKGQQNRMDSKIASIEEKIGEVTQ